MQPKSFISKTDSYKVSHPPLYPPDTTKVYSYWESRQTDVDLVFFGLQPLLMEHFCGEVFDNDDIDEMDIVFEEHFGRKSIYNRGGWDHILKEYNGKLPLRIKAVPEGLVVPGSNAMLTVENMDPKSAWLTNYAETLLSHLWYPTTVASNSYHIKNLMRPFVERTCDDMSSLNFMLHDFGCRGVANYEQAIVGGMAHLLSFRGTDTVPALLGTKWYYDAEAPAGYSIPATEHSTITAWGAHREKEAYLNVLKKFPTGLVACVSDSYDIFNACRNIWGHELKQEVLARDGKLVIRPDSGIPLDTVMEVLKILWTQFGGTINSKGFKVLDPHVGVIQGDGVCREVILEILTAMEKEGYAASNIAFGSGGNLLQNFNRDTYKFAIKCSYTENCFGKINVFKDPVTDPGKASKMGRLSLVKDFRGKLVTVPGCVDGDLLEVVFEEGTMVRNQYWEDIVK